MKGGFYSCLLYLHSSMMLLDNVFVLDYVVFFCGCFPRLVILFQALSQSCENW